MINYSHIKAFLSAVNLSSIVVIPFDLLLELDKGKVIFDLQTRTKKTEYIILQIKQAKIENLAQKEEWSFKWS